MIDQGVAKPVPRTEPLQFKRGSHQAFYVNNPLLLKGEPAYEWDTKKMKVGDGVTPYMILHMIFGLNKVILELLMIFLLHL